MADENFTEEEKISVTQHEREVRRWFIAFLVVLAVLVGFFVWWIVQNQARERQLYGWDYIWLEPEQNDDLIVYG